MVKIIRPDLIEVIHEYIRRFIEQGTDIDNYSDKDILLMMNYINNAKREKLNGKTHMKLKLTNSELK